MTVRKNLCMRAYGKINLTLDILGRMENGYHEVEMIMQQVSLYDSVQISEKTDGPAEISSNCPWLPSDGRNLAYKAAEAFARATGYDVPVKIRIGKYIPVASGLAGGSSDAAAVLRGLNILTKAGLSTEELCKIGRDIGSDVPFCITGGTALATGRGDELRPLPPMPDCRILLAKPRLSVSTPAAYAEFDRAKNITHPDTASCIQALEHGDLAALAAGMHNVFEDSLPIPEVEKLKQIMKEHGALCANMSGSGPTVFGIFTDESAVLKARAACRACAPFVFYCRPAARRRGG